MAGRGTVKKIEIPVDLIASTEKIQNQIQGLKAQVLKVFKDSPLELEVGKSFKDLNRDLQRLQNFKLNTSNVEEFNKLLAKTEMEFEAVAKASLKPLENNLKNAEDKLAKAEKKLNENEDPKRMGGLTAAKNRATKEKAAAAKAIEDQKKLLKESSAIFEDWHDQGAEAQKELDTINFQEKQGEIENFNKKFFGAALVFGYVKDQIHKLVETFKELDQSLTAIAAVSGKTRDQMWAQVGTFNEMAQRLGATTNEVLKASKLYYQQGRTTTEVMQLTEQTTILATIAELDFADATQYMTAAINGFKLEAEDATMITDVWGKLAATTAVDVSDLAVAISKVASLAGNAGMTLQTTSAFLTQMIATTQEAPENLGTALKTIIARFQELKLNPDEIMEDGASANRVEAALATADVALRDASGTFRDFDDVILELSSKWKGLDRNTQRYIATIAAGSRQQSRFIALVEDYDGLMSQVENAQDSAGASTAQFGVFMTGLDAALNRLQTAWEGFYTSLNSGANIISWIIDLIASIVNNFAQLGVGWTAFIVLIALFTIKTLGAAMAVNKLNAGKSAEVRTQLRLNIAQLLGITLTKADAASNKKLIPLLWEKAAATWASYGIYAAIAIILVVIIAGTIALINAEANRLKQLKEEIALHRENAAAATQSATALKQLQKETEKSFKAGEGFEKQRQSLIDNFGEVKLKNGKLVKDLALEASSYEQLITVMEQLRKEKLLEAASEATKGAFASAQSKVSGPEWTRYNNRAELLNQSEKDIQEIKDMYIGRTDEGWEEELELDLVGILEQRQRMIDTLAEIRAKIGDYFSESEIQQIAATFEVELSTDFDIINKKEASEKWVEFIGDSMALIDETGEKNQEAINNYTQYMKDMQIFQKGLSEDELNVFDKILNEDYLSLTDNQINDIVNKLPSQLNKLKDLLIKQYGDFVEDTNTAFAQEFSQLHFTDISTALKKQLLTAFADISNTNVKRALGSAAYALSKKGFTFSDLSDGAAIFSDAATRISALKDAAEPVPQSLYDTLAVLIDFNNFDFSRITKASNEFSSFFNTIKDGSKEGLDLTSFLNLLKEVGDEDVTLAANISTYAQNLDVTTGKIKLNAEQLANLANAKKKLAQAELELEFSTALSLRASKATELETLKNTGASETLIEAKEKELDNADAIATTYDKVIKSYKEVTYSASDFSDATNQVIANLQEEKEGLEEDIEALEKYNNALQETIDIKNNELLPILEVQKEILEQYLKDLEEEQELQQENLELTVKAAEKAYDLQIQLIQDKIDALNEENEANEEALNLQKARDAYEAAKSSKSRMVLTAGAGWLFKTDDNAIAEAKKEVDDLEREAQIKQYEDEIKTLEENKQIWSDLLEDSDRTSSELEQEKQNINNFSDAIASGTVDPILNQANLQLLALQELNDTIEYENSERANSAQETINALENIIEKIGYSAEELIQANKDEEYRNSLLAVRNIEGIDSLKSTINDTLNQTNEYITGELVDKSQEIVDNLNTIKDYEKDIANKTDLINKKEADIKTSTKNTETNTKKIDGTIYDWRIDYQAINDLGISDSPPAASRSKKDKENFGMIEFTDNTEQSITGNILITTDETAISATNADISIQNATISTNMTPSKSNAPKFASGGKIDYTGPAWVDGTPTKPEWILNDSQMKLLSSMAVSPIKIPGFSPNQTNSSSGNSLNNCQFYITSPVDSIESLLDEVSRISPLIPDR